MRNLVSLDLKINGSISFTFAFQKPEVERTYSRQTPKQTPKQTPRKRVLKSLENTLYSPIRSNSIQKHKRKKVEEEVSNSLSI